ncbi:hypothetical protein VT84_06385 [Gemmata sp. SH-PL17]|uniref:hypothetical protein n=1 Tax=Gemmata sp. SH-PL17 TaxID=1630693 RepID=UPI00078E3A07|nr:hypothetical protein [Gemmata sp. SH-PL17]AMV24004.1 hypothetical protein VT84_06385 [Gemmata sp. SH-PL17]
MIAPQFIHGVRPEGFLEVDAARLLLILHRFARPAEEQTFPARYAPAQPFVAHFASEYYLQKLDFLLRYPAYFIHELTELYQENAADRDIVIATIRQIHRDREPELQTIPFRKFWRGAYERRDDVEAWWWSRGLVYIRFELRGSARPWKHYFLTQAGVDVAERLVRNLSHAQWYADRIGQIHHYMGHLSASDIKDRQYRHARYKDANLNEYIPDLTAQEIADNFFYVFGEQLEVSDG